ncbi:MAG: ATP-binding protein [Armatimonadetes bacterium]|nr:ATP-binding protein [Armatimonadota bacterium]
MKTLQVQVKDDYLQRVVGGAKPIHAIAELIWNGLDADAELVTVEFARSPLGAIDEIVVTDDGHGISYAEADDAFGNLGGSWKRPGRKSRRHKRILHGKAGKGRFRAFTLGHSVIWETNYSDNGALSSYRIHGNFDRLAEFRLEDPQRDGHRKTGTAVRITNLRREFESLTQPDAIAEITETFALYLRNYPGVSIVYDGRPVDYFHAIVSECNLEVAIPELAELVGENPMLTVIEWAFKTEKRILLCDTNGVARDEIPAGVSSTANFTAYLKSQLIQDSVDENALQLLELDPRIRVLVESARKTLRSYLRSKEAEKSADIIEQWKQEGIYPYPDEPTGPLDQARRDVFDICAASISNYLPEFDSSEQKTRKFQLRLLRETLEERPEETLKVVQELLDLPQAKVAELAELLRKTSLAAVINAAKTVADRLNFLRGLEILVFDPASKEALRERSQLHRVLADHTWIFGEEFHLSVDDQSLDEVLRKHLKLLGRKDEVAAPVLRADGSKGIVDLMLSRRVPQPRVEEREHLVIELKAPRKKIDQKAMTQIQDYAFAVEADERFKDTGTRWVFWLLSNEIADPVQRMARQKDKPLGLLYESDDGKTRIWVKTWGQVIEDCKARLKFYEDHLQYQPDCETALQYLRRRHSDHIPECLITDEKNGSGGSYVRSDAASAPPMG